MENGHQVYTRNLTLFEKYPRKFENRCGQIGLTKDFSIINFLWKIYFPEVTVVFKSHENTNPF